MLASRRGSVPSAGRGMRRGSLDMVAEEQSTDPINSDNTMTSLQSLKVPRHRNRSRSLDNSLETNNSFAAFKESLKVRLSTMAADGEIFLTVNYHNRDFLQTSLCQA